METQKFTKLNIGSGKFKKAGYLNLDGYTEFGPDILHDLKKIPYPFNVNQFEIIEADHVIEHLDNPFDVIRELHRISRPEGLIIIRVPHFSRGFTHPEHRSGFDVSLPYYFDPLFSARYTNDIQMELVSLRLRWLSQPYLKKTALPFSLFYAAFILGKLIDFFANISPMLCSRIWCFWVGGFEEIEYIFKVKK